MYIYIFRSTIILIVYSIECNFMQYTNKKIIQYTYRITVFQTFYTKRRAIQ